MGGGRCLPFSQLHKGSFYPLPTGLAHCAAQEELARSVTMEQGKTLSDARGDVFRGLGEGGQGHYRGWG